MLCPLFRFTFLLLTLFVCSAIHLNPEPKRNRSFYNFSIYHWNLNSITAHNYEKINLLKDVQHSRQIWYDLHIQAVPRFFNIVWKGTTQYQPLQVGLKWSSSNVSKGGVFAYFRESLPVRCISNPYLNECLIFEVSVYNKKGYVVPLYRLPSQTSD